MSELYITDNRQDDFSLDANRLKISLSNSAIVTNSSLLEFSRIDRFCRFQNAFLGRHSYVGQSCVVMSTKIEHFVSIAWNVTIGARDHPMDLASQHSFTYNHYDSIVSDCYPGHEHPNTSIGSDVWVAAGACIMAGLTLAPGSVVGANSVLTTDTEPYGIYCGAPARLKKFRFEDDIMFQLLKLAWWEYSDRILANNQSFFLSPPTSKSISEFTTAS
jgi:virginiamycin A acetyltransferase